MSRPPINPEKSVAGIAVDPQTLERVIPESKRPDGTVRKQIKIRPGFTPQEDVRRFRGTKQAQMDANALPKGHIIGWAPPPTSTASSAANGAKPMSKAAKKNAKRKEKREKEKVDGPVPDNWDDEDEEETKVDPPSSSVEPKNPAPKAAPARPTANVFKAAIADATKDLTNKIEKLNVKSET